MAHREFNTEELAEYLHLTVTEVTRLLRETDLPHATRGGRLTFRRSEIDAWASQRILGMQPRRLGDYHAKSMRGTRTIFPEAALVPELLAPGGIELGLPGKTRASVIREVVGLAERTGRVLDAKELLASVQAREALCSTALPGGLALLHARHYAPYRYEGSFLVVGRTHQPIPFSAPDGRPTSLFFLICCEDDRIHLHTLARLCLIVQDTDVIAQLSAAEDAEAAYAALVQAERSVLPGRGDLIP